MTWSEPFALIGLAAIPLAFYFITKRVKKINVAVENALSSEMASRLAPPKSLTLVAVKQICLAAALVAFVLALAGPKFGRVEETRAAFGRDIFVLLDVSDSMLAEDVAPNRLTVAKLDVEDFVDAAVGDRIGLIAFAGSAQVEIPPTSDRVFFRELLQSVDVNSVRLGGTAIGDAIRLALSRFGDEPGRERAIVLITDGEDWDSLPLEAARNAADASVPVFAVAIGDPRGAKIPTFDAAGRRVGFKTFDGEIATSKPDVETLKKIAKTTGGRYYFADATFDFADVYNDGIDQLNRARIDEKSRVLLKDRYRPFLAFGLFAFAAYYYLPTRTRRTKIAPKIALAAAFLSPLGDASSLFAQNADSQINDKTETAQAAVSQNFKLDADSVLKNRRSEIDAFNRSVDAARNGRLDEARRIQTILRDAKSPEVVARANFNLGADATRSLLEIAQKLAEEPTSAETPVRPDATKNAAPPPDAVARYEKERAERDSLQAQAERELREAARRFGDAQNRPSTRLRARAANDALSSWETKNQTARSRRERSERDKILANPDDRLRWLDAELSRRSERAAPVNATSGGAAFYQTLFDESRALSELDVDVETVASQFAARLADERGDADGARKIAAAKDEFLKRGRAAATRFAEYDATGGRAELAGAADELSAIRDVAAPYETLLSQRVTAEEKTTGDFSAATIRDASNETATTFVRSRENLRRSVDELLRKAKNGIENAPPSGANGGAASPIAAAPNAEAIRESMKIAVERGPELHPLINEIQRLATSRERRESADLIAAAQKKILDILKEIAKPLQEENPSNQNQDQNDSQSDAQNQDSSKENDSPNDQKSRSENDSDEKNGEKKHASQSQTPEELNEGERPSDEMKKDDSHPNDSEKNDAAQPKRDAENPASLDQLKTPEQKEADALVRRAVRRQKDAEAERRAVRNALKKREKSGKDW